ncbi:MAG: hypothetical protein H7A23_16950 [Leptospiraceae bacterium]|nr:hypothetical protein [Leptospiraceae bacterium]MCP5496236.1 hypothetical protein [Leptospiraceae bacterium]
MLDLFAEFSVILKKLEEEKLDYAVCGGMAMAIHGFLRATVDIDIVLMPENIRRCKGILKNLGYLLDSEPMKLGKGEIIIHRLTKVEKESEDFLVIDILEVTKSIQSVWENKIKVNWDYGVINVVDKKGLIELKRMRNSKVDQEDIERLEKYE